MRQTVTAAVSGALLALAVSACAATSPAGSARAADLFDGPAALSKTAPVWWQAPQMLADPPVRLGSAVGRARTVLSRRANLTVTVHRLIDPLAHSGASLPPGTRAVAAIVQIRNTGPATYDSSATEDFSLRVSRGPVTPVYVTRGICKTPIEDFDRAITAGEDRVGCVAFSIASTARVEAVVFSPHGQAAGHLFWRRAVVKSLWRPRS